jgi:hypothetical protein
MVSPGNNGSNYNNKAIWSGSPRPTTVGTNSGPSYYGTYDQDGNVSEIVIGNFPGPIGVPGSNPTFYGVGGDYSSSTIGINKNYLTTTAATSPSMGFRLVATEYTNIQISSVSPEFFNPNSGIVQSFYINNYENFSITGLQISGYYTNILNPVWSGSYDPSSSGTISGSENILINCNLGPSGSLVINFSGICRSQVVLLSNSITLYTSNNYSLQQNYHSMISNVSSDYSLTTLNYNNKFSQLDWGSISPNSFVLVDDIGNSSPFDVFYQNNLASYIGGVNYYYNITKYYITNNEYCLFLNSVDPQGTNPQNIYSTYVPNTITYSSGNINSNKYSVITSGYNRGNKPIDNIPVANMLRYCNWLSNGGKSYNTTSSGVSAPQNTGSYNIGTGVNILSTIPRGTGRFRLPDAHEIIKASYYRGSDSVYWNFGTKTNSAPISVGVNTTTRDSLLPSGVSGLELRQSYNTANLGTALTTAGTNGASSPYGLYDVEGSVMDVTHHGSNFFAMRNSSWKSTTTSTRLNSLLFVSVANLDTEFNSGYAYGFRVVSSGLFGDILLDLDSPGAYYYQSTPIQATATIENTTNLPGTCAVILSVSGQNLSSSGYWTPYYFNGATGPNSVQNKIQSSVMTFPANSKVVFTLVNATPNTVSTTPIVITGNIIPTGFDDLVSTNNNDSIIKYIDSQTNLGVSMTGSQVVNKGNTISYDIRISNTGSSYVSGINLSTNILPSSLNNINYTWKQDLSRSTSSIVAIPSSGTGSIFSTNISLLPNTYSIFAISGLVTNTYYPITAYSSISVTGNQSGFKESSTSTSFGPTDLHIKYSGIPIYHTDGEYINYKIIINNSGNNDSINSRFIHDFTNLSNVNWSISYALSSSGIASGSGNIDTYILLGSNDSAVVVVDAIASNSNNSEILLTSSITPTIITDSNLSNNTNSTGIPHSIIINNIKYSENSCDNNGYITIGITGGIPPYSYTINNETIVSSSKTLTVKNLTAGTYSPLVSDSTNFRYFYPNTINIIDSSIITTMGNIYTPLLLDSYGIVNLSVAGSGAPYSFVFTNSTDNSISVPLLETKYIVSSETDNSLINYRFDDLLTPDDYSYFIQDKYGCLSSGSFNIPNISELVVQVSTIDDNPIVTTIPSLTLDIFDTILIPYKHIKNNTNLWKLIKTLDLKDYISILINNEKYEYRIVRDMLDKHCVDTENNIELLKLGNSEEDWYFFFYIAPSVNLTNDQTNINSSFEILDTNTEEKFLLTLGLSQTNTLEQDSPSLIKGSFILNGLGYNEYSDNNSANIAIGYNSDNQYNYSIKNIKKVVLNNIYNVGFVTTISFLEQFNITREYITIGQTSCNLSKEDYQYKLNIKNLLIDINNFNNINNIYILNSNSISHNGQLNSFITGNDTFITEDGTLTNTYSIEYFTFDKDSTNLKYFEINNEVIKNTNVISELDSRYVIIRSKDAYNNIPKNVSINGTISSYDNHFIDAQRDIQNYNNNILSQFKYGDVLVFIKDQSSIDYTAQTTGLDPNTGLPGVVTLPGTTNSLVTNIIEQTKDSTDTGSLLLQIPSKTEVEIFGPNNYFAKVSSNTTFKNLIPGLYIIRGNEESLKKNNLYQNELRFLISKNILSTMTIEFTSYTNKLFIKDQT